MRNATETVPAARLARRPFGHTGLEVTPLALAAFAVRGAGPRGRRLTPDDVERAFHEYGINTFLFHWSMRAMVAGLRRLLASGHRHELVLIAEAGIHTAWGIRRAWRRHARALGVDVIDVFLLGWVRSRWSVAGRSWPALRALRDAGAVRVIGFSSHDRPLAAALAQELDLDALMVRYNAAHRGAESEVFGRLGARRPAIIAYTATRWGMLLQPLPAAGFPVGMTGGECYRFALSHPAVDLVLCAARHPDELRDDVAAARRGPLSTERLEEVRRFGDAVHAAARGGRRWMFQ
ncbi:MAG: aldo/keto reductase [Gemmatimonadota bacterium]|nr:aldo/keto reductase [Gemmatimonadota bacterium]